MWLRHPQLATVPAAATQSGAELLARGGTGAGGSEGGVQLHDTFVLVHQGTSTGGLKSLLSSQKQSPDYLSFQLTFPQHQRLGQAWRAEQRLRHRWANWPITQTNSRVVSAPATTPAAAETHGHHQSSRPPGGMSVITQSLMEIHVMRM